MPRVAVSGYVVGFRFRENKEGKRYGVVDLLQFGSQQSDSEIVPLLIYDTDLLIRMNQHYIVGQIKPAAFTCNIVLREKGGWMWIADSIVDIRKDVSKESFTTTAIVNGTGPDEIGEDKELTMGSLTQ